MDCLDDRIGIRYTGAPVAELYVNDLPGVTLDNIDALAADEDDGFLDVWRKVKLAVKKKFEILLRAEFNKCCQLTGTVIDCIVCGTDPLDPLTYVNEGLFDVPLWYLHGVELMIVRTSTDAMNRYTTIDLDKAEKLKGDFYAEFQGSLSDAVRAINVKDSDCITDDCVTSNQSSQWVFNL